MFYDFIYLAKGFRMRPKVRSTLKYKKLILPVFVIFESRSKPPLSDVERA